MVLDYVDKAGDVLAPYAFTPYQIAKELNLSAGSVTAACKSLVRDGHLKCFGESPYMVGKKRDAV